MSRKTACPRWVFQKFCVDRCCTCRRYTRMYSVDMCSTRWNQSGLQCANMKRTNHSPDGNTPIIPARKTSPLIDGSFIIYTQTLSTIVCSRNNIIRNALKIPAIIITLNKTQPPSVLIKWIGNKNMWPLKYYLTPRFRFGLLPNNQPFLLCALLMPALRNKQPLTTNDRNIT